MEKYEIFEKQYKIFNGYILNDPTFKYFEKGSCICKFTIPLKKNKDDVITWLNCECWNNVAEFIAEKYHKGSEITVLGEFKESEFQGKKYINFIVKVAM